VRLATADDDAPQVTVTAPAADDPAETRAVIQAMTDRMTALGGSLGVEVTGSTVMTTLRLPSSAAVG
jgi:hypothetical protein